MRRPAIVCRCPVRNVRKRRDVAQQPILLAGITRGGILSILYAAMRLERGKVRAAVVEAVEGIVVAVEP